MTFGRNIGGGATAQCVAPDHNTRLGTGGTATLSVPDGGSAESAVFPRDGVVICTIPATAVRVRIDINAVATADDMSYTGETVYWPVSKGERVSFFGDGALAVVTVVMAK